MKREIHIIYVSDYITSKCTKMNRPITNLYLQKILYLVEKEYLKLYKESLFNADIYAWKFGPVFEDVYYHYSDYGSMEIINLEENTGDKISQEVKLIIDNVIDLVIDLEPFELARLVQFKGSAWDKNYSTLRKNLITSIDILSEEN